MRLLILCLGVLLLAGCKPSATKPEGKEGSGIIETMTQKSKADAGRRAADQLREIDEQRHEEMESVMGEW